MPNVKQGGGYTLTFSKKNQDVKELLDSKKENGAVVTEYVCASIRFYEQYKDKIGNANIDLNMVEELVNKKMELLKKELLSSNITKEEIVIEENKNTNFYLENVGFGLEKKINIDDD